jgi:hypothetical protein
MGFSRLVGWMCDANGQMGRTCAIAWGSFWLPNLPSAAARRIWRFLGPNAGVESVGGAVWRVETRVLTPTWLEPGCQLPARGPGSTRQLLSPTVRVPREKIGFHPSIHLLHVSAIMHTVAQHEKYPKVSPCCVMHHRRHSPQPRPQPSPAAPNPVKSDPTQSRSFNESC